MDACLGVEREVVKVLEKFTNIRDQNIRTIDELLNIVRNARTELQNGKCPKIVITLIFSQIVINDKPASACNRTRIICFSLASAISSLNDPAIIHAQAAEPVSVNMDGNDSSSAHGISISTQPPVTPSQLSPAQTVMLVHALQTIKDSTQKVASDHRDLHSSVSKVSNVSMLPYV